MPGLVPGTHAEPPLRCRSLRACSAGVGGRDERGHDDLHLHPASHPPSTIRFAPVMKLAWSLDRNSAALATS